MAYRPKRPRPAQQPNKSRTRNIVRATIRSKTRTATDVLDDITRIIHDAHNGPSKPKPTRLRILGQRVTTGLRTGARAGYKASRYAYRRGKIAAQKGIKATASTIGRILREQNFGGVDERNRLLPGFTMTAAQYDQERLKDRAAQIERKKIQDSQSHLGIATHPFYSKTEQAGGAVVARRVQAANAANAAARRFRQQQTLKNRQKRKFNSQSIRDSIRITGLAKIGKNLDAFINTPTKPVIEAQVNVFEKALHQNTPRKTGNLDHSISHLIGDSQGKVYFDLDKAYYAPMVDGGTPKLKARRIIRKTYQQTKNQLYKAGANAFKNGMKFS